MNFICPLLILLTTIHVKLISSQRSDIQGRHLPRPFFTRDQDRCAHGVRCRNPDRIPDEGEYRTEKDRPDVLTRDDWPVPPSDGRPGIGSDYKPPKVDDDKYKESEEKDDYKPKPVGEDDYAPKPVGERDEYKPKPVGGRDDYKPKPVPDDDYVPKPVGERDEYKPKPVGERDEYKPKPVGGRDDYKPKPVPDDDYVKPVGGRDDYKPKSEEDDDYKPKPVVIVDYEAKPVERVDMMPKPVITVHMKPKPVIIEDYKPRPGSGSSRGLYPRPIEWDEYNSRPGAHRPKPVADRDEHNPKPVRDRDDYHPKPVKDEDDYIAKPVRDRDDYNPKPVGHRDDYNPKPVRDRDDYNPKPVRDRDDHNPKPVRDRDDYNPKPVGHRDDYNPKPVRDRDDYIPKPVRDRDDYNPKPVRDRDDHNPRPVRDRDDYNPKPVRDRDPKPIRDRDEYNPKPVDDKDYYLPKPVGGTDDYDTKPIDDKDDYSVKPLRPDLGGYKEPKDDDYNNDKDDDDEYKETDYGDDGAPESVIENKKCICVPYYQCQDDGRIVTDGSGIIDARKRKDPVDHTSEAKPNPRSCGPYHVCCDAPQTSTVKPYEHRCGVRNPSGINSRILSPSNKGEADFGEWPWQAAVLKSEGKVNIFQCGGVLIDKFHVLTVAHCVYHLYKYNEYPLKVRLGEWDTQTTTEFLAHEDYKVAKIYIHPDYVNSSLWNDLAVLKLEEAVLFAPHIDTVCLPKYDEVFAGQNCVVTGWGKDAYKGGTFSNVMKEVALHVIDNYKCEEMLRKTRLGRFFQLHEGFVCAGGEHGVDSCKGDGGGPLVCYRKDKSYALAGIVSWGIDCGQPGVPGVYVKMQKYLDWISKTTGVNLQDYWPRH